LALAVVVAAPLAWADPPVKVCVAVAGDADETMRAAAETAVDVIAHRDGFRGVADADARAALRGDTPAAPADVADLSAARRALRGTDADAAQLDAVSTRLGCGLVMELAATPQGMLVRVYDPVRHAWASSRSVNAVDAALVDGVLPAALEARRTAPRVRAPARSAAATAPTPSRGLWSSPWPWVVVGGVVLLTVGAFFLAQDAGAGGNTTHISVVHPGSP
jgi:hypothetical protein